MIRAVAGAMLITAVLQAPPAPGLQLESKAADAAGTGSVAYRDAAGKWRVTEPGDWRRTRAGDAATTTLSGQNTITITYMDVASDIGAGFDHPELGQQRRGILEAAVGDIDAVIMDGGALDLEVRESETDGSGSLASDSTFFPTAPNGIHQGAAQMHLTTGSDPFAGVPDMILRVDFGFNWNSTLNLPASGEVDLYSVLLHELVHGLGLISLSDENGASVVSGSRPGVFSTFDDLLVTGNGVDLWNAQGQFQGLSGDLGGADGGIEFRGSDAMAVFGDGVPLHTPDAFESGSSLVHWQNMAAADQALMQPAIRNGEVLRMPLAFELAALKDIGYQIQNPAENSAFDFTAAEGSWINQQTPGEGLFFDFGPSLEQLFVAWFTFTLDPDANGPGGGDVGNPDQRWMTALLNLDPATGSAAGTLRARNGGEFDAPPRPGESNPEVGEITVVFSSCDRAQVEYTIDSVAVSGSFEIVPLEKAVNPDGFQCGP